MEPMGIRKYLAIFRIYTKVSLMMAMEYRSSFFVELAVELGYTAWFVFFYLVLFDNISAIGGWTKYEVLFLAGLSLVIMELLVGFVFVWGTRILPEKIKDGDIDYVLLKPIHPLFSLTMGRPYLSALITTIPGFVMMYIAWRELQLLVSVQQIMGSIFLSICGLIIGYCLLAIPALLTFVFENAQLLPRVGFSIVDYATRPHTIFAGVWKFVVMTFVPIAFIASVPSEILLKGMSIHMLIQGSVICCLFVYLTVWLWNTMARRYSSAGS